MPARRGKSAANASGFAWGRSCASGTGYPYGVLALAAAIIWLLTAPFIGAFDNPANGLYLGLALFAAHFAVDIGIPFGRRG